jgi:hypothetical protein
MKQATKNQLLSFAALLLAFPAAYFIGISVLKYNFGINSPFDSIAPTLESWGIKHFGWNINLLIVFGPVSAVILTVFQVLKFQIRFTKEEFRLNLSIQKKWFPLLIATFAASLLAILFFYMLGENCNC